MVRTYALRVRVLHLSWEYPPVMYGGLGRHVHALAEQQAARGDDVTVITQAAEGAPEVERLNGVDVVRVPPDAPWVPFDATNLIAWVSGLNTAMARAGLGLLRTTAFDVVHGHDWLVAQASVIVAEAAGARYVTTMHATEAGRHQGWLPSDTSRAIHSVEWWSTSAAARVITCSEHMKWEVLRLFEPSRSKVAVIPNGIDPAQWQVSSSRRARTRRKYGTPLVVFSGRLEWEKGVHTLIDAVPRLRRRVPGVHVVIAGKGSADESLRRQARDKRVGKSVTFTGWVPEEQLRSLVAAADVAVVPSIYEPFGLVALEAAALSTPLVVARTGGLAELVHDGETGWTFTPGNPADLAAALTDALSSPKLARRLARAARRAVVDRHGWPAIADRTELLYHDALLADRPSAAEAPVLRIVEDTNLLTGAQG